MLVKGVDNDGIWGCLLFFVRQLSFYHEPEIVSLAIDLHGDRTGSSRRAHTPLRIFRNLPSSVGPIPCGHWRRSTDAFYSVPL